MTDAEKDDFTAHIAFQGQMIELLMMQVVLLLSPDKRLERIDRLAAHVSSELSSLQLDLNPVRANMLVDKTLTHAERVFGGLRRTFAQGSPSSPA